MCKTCCESSILATRFHLLAWLLPVLLLSAGCRSTQQTAGDISQEPLVRDRPGTSIRYKNTDTTRWEGSPAQGSGILYRYKPMACATPSVVMVQSSRAPTRNPGPTALRQAVRLIPSQVQAANIMMTAASEGGRKVQSLSSTATTIRSYQAIVSESRIDIAGNPPTFQTRADVYMGLAFVQVTSSARDRTLAKRNMLAFIDGIEIADLAA